MTDTNQLPPLPSLQAGDSHMESLIEAAIQGHASTRDAMRWLVRQLVPVLSRAQLAQGETVTDEQMDSLAREHAGEPESYTFKFVYEFEPTELRAYTDAILSMRPAAQESRIAELEAELAKRHQRLHETEELAGHYLAQRDDLAAEIGRLKTVIDELERREIRSVAQQATPGALTKAWDDGYRLGVEDERNSEANIGVAGFGAKVNPARQNPYRAQQATPEPVGEPAGEPDRYDAGLLNDFGGGNVEWWQDYIREELDRAHDFYRAQMDTRPTHAAQADAFTKSLDIRAAQGWKLTGNAIPVLYTDSINGEQVCRDDVWLCTTDALKQEAPAAQAVPMTEAWFDSAMRLADAYADACFDQALTQRTEDPNPEAKREKLVEHLRHHGITAQAREVQS